MPHTRSLPVCLYSEIRDSSVRRNHRLLLMVCADTLVVSGVRVADLAAEETGCGVPGLEWFHVILRNDSVDGSW